MALVPSSAHPGHRSPGCGMQTCWPYHMCGPATLLGLSPLQYVAYFLTRGGKLLCAKEERMNYKPAVPCWSFQIFSSKSAASSQQFSLKICLQNICFAFCKVGGSCTMIKTKTKAVIKFRWEGYK